MDIRNIVSSISALKAVNSTKRGELITIDGSGRLLFTQNTSRTQYIYNDNFGIPLGVATLALFPFTSMGSVASRARMAV